MDSRDADETDAEAIADLVGTSLGSAERMVRERTVRIARRASDAPAAALVSFDATPEAVQITRLAGETDACGALLEEPIRYADREGLPVEMVVPRRERAVCELLAANGFTQEGAGPTFESGETVRYRRPPAPSERCGR